jgi:hypothetical protein
MCKYRIQSSLESNLFTIFFKEFENRGFEMWRIGSKIGLEILSELN